MVAICLGEAVNGCCCNAIMTVHDVDFYVVGGPQRAC